MKICIALVLAAWQSTEEAPAPHSVSMTVTTRHKDAARPNQLPQYGLASIFAKWGFKVESRVATKWDKALAKQTVKVPALKEGEAPPPPDPAAFTIEGSIDLIPKQVQFYGKALDLICFVADVKIVVKDAKGKELKKIAWMDYCGRSKDAGEETVLVESETRAARFLAVDLFEIKEIAGQVAKEKQEEFAKFLAKEREQRDKLFDDYTKHESKKR